MGFRPVTSDPSVETETRLRRAGAEGWLGPGDIELLLGVGLTSSQDADTQRITVDSNPGEPAIQTGLFVPGQLTAHEIAQISNVRPNPKAVLRQLEAHLKTAPSAADNVDNMTLRVRGGASGQQDLAMNQAGTRKFAYDKYTEALVMDATANLSVAIRSWATRLSPVGDQDITTVGFHRPDMAWFGGNAWDGRGIILDAARNRIGQTEAVDVQSFPSNSWRDIPLESTVSLLDANDYFIGWEFLEGSTEGGAWSQNDTQTGYTIAGTSPRVIYSDSVEPDYTLWTDGTFDAAPIRCQGTPTGVTLTGNLIVVELIQVGTGGTPGSDLNIFAAFDPE